jgi:putative acetyltransferase
MSDVQLEIVKPNRDDVIGMINALDSYLVELYPAESNHLLDIQALMHPSVTFIIATLDGETVGCGAFRVMGDDGNYAEIKRMFVKPTCRGKGVGYQILRKLESLAKERGLTLARLETGISQPEALKLYEQMGYIRRTPFGEYPDDPLSMCYEKKLTEPSIATA